MTARLLDLAEYVDHFRLRLLQDAILEATSAYWSRRAEQFERVGNARCDEVATACRARASIALLQGDDIDVDLLDVLLDGGHADHPRARISCNWSRSASS